MARCFDLAVLGQQRPNELTGENEIIQAALFDSGRPVLVVPYIQSQGLRLNRAMVCWDGSRAAARAVADAMPFLTRVDAVDVVMVVGEPNKNDEIPGFDIAEHLARHGITTLLENVYSARGDVTAAILNRVQDAEVDLLVMGGYGHSRLREFVLGGVTRGVLATMTTPVPLSH
jgi:nucleotide-binding universal stress UspA family protein